MYSVIVNYGKYIFFSAELADTLSATLSDLIVSEHILLPNVSLPLIFVFDWFDKSIMMFGKIDKKNNIIHAYHSICMYRKNIP